MRKTLYNAIANTGLLTIAEYVMLMPLLTMAVVGRMANDGQCPAVGLAVGRYTLRIDAKGGISHMKSETSSAFVEEFPDIHDIQWWNGPEWVEWQLSLNTSRNHLRNSPSVSEEVIL